MQYDAHNKALQQLMQLFVTLGGRIIESKDATEEYDPEFVKKIERSRKSEGKKIALENLWN